MKTIAVTMEQEKYEALNFYLEKNGKEIQKELEDNLKTLYEETVPKEVREYIEYQAQNRLLAKEQAQKEKEQKNRKKAFEKNMEEEKKSCAVDKKQKGEEKGAVNESVKSNL